MGQPKPSLTAAHGPIKTWWQEDAALSALRSSPERHHDRGAYAQEPSGR